MTYVILRDDDTNAFTSPSRLEELYRPFLAHGLPVCLATIPEVGVDVRRRDGVLEGFLGETRADATGVRPIAENRNLVEYLLHEPGYEIAQHGLHHEIVDGRFEFDRDDSADIAGRLDRGQKLLVDAGFPPPTTFVAPQDQMSRTSLAEVAGRYAVVSTGWYSRHKVPVAMWPQYLWVKKVRRQQHWRARGTTFLSHPGCLFSYHHSVEGMLERVVSIVERQRLTVVVSHHWEYFADGVRNQALIDVLHEFADYLAHNHGVSVVRFADAPRLVR